jgi:hypothetical protein
MHVKHTGYLHTGCLSNTHAFTHDPNAREMTQTLSHETTQKLPQE